LLNPRPFFSYVFECFSARRVQKHHKNLLQKVYVEIFPKKNKNNFNVSFSSIFLSRVSGCFLAMKVQTHHKTFCQKLKAPTKNRPPKKALPKSDLSFFSVLFITFLGVSRRGEFEITFFFKTEKTEFDPGPFLASDPPTYHNHTGVPSCCLGGPLSSAPAGRLVAHPPQVKAAHRP
jgi:hypothetical protein